MRKKSQQEWIIVIKGKLIPIDNCLPFLVGLKHNRPDCSITVITPTPGYHQMLKKELFLHQMVLKYGIEIRAPEVSESIFQRFKRRTLLILFLLRASLFQKIFFLDIHLLGNVGRAVSLINKYLHQGKSFGLLLSNMESKAEAYFNEIAAKELKRKPPVYMSENLDGLLVSIGTDRYQNSKEMTKYKKIDVGYARGQPVWLNEIEKSEIEQEELKSFKNGFVFWPLSIIKRDERGKCLFDLSFSISNSLKIFREVRPEIGIVFRYHPTTERDHFLQLLEESRFQNYHISSAHPLILVKQSEFVFSNIGTTIYSDAWFHRVPVIQYSPDPHIVGKHDLDRRIIAPSYAPIVNNFMKTESEFRLFLQKWPNPQRKKQKLQTEKDVLERMQVANIKNIIEEIESL